MHCGLLRTDLSPQWVEQTPAGRALQQIDSGEDFMFVGLIVPSPSPCPRCLARDKDIVLVPVADAGKVGAYIEQHLWRRASG